jgi:hypothetical protein
LSVEHGGGVSGRVFGGWPDAARQQGTSGKETRSVSVTAIGRASAEADAATVHIGYVIYGPDATIRH